MPGDGKVAVLAMHHTDQLLAVVGEIELGTSPGGTHFVHAQMNSAAVDRAFAGTDEIRRDWCEVDNFQPIAILFDQMAEAAAGVSPRPANGALKRSLGCVR